jgi:restriction system protein
MQEFAPRRFEETVAELFRRMGYDVVLAPRAKDGGIDVLAFQKGSVGTLLTVVECKRFRPDRKVGVGLVRSLYGVVEEKACDIWRDCHTTSSFTKGARQFQQNLQYRLSLHDFTDLVSWCKTYTRK